MAYVRQPDGSIKWVSPTGEKPPILGQIGGAIQNMGVKIGTDWTNFIQSPKDRNVQADAERNARMMAAYSAKNPAASTPPGNLSFFDPKAASLEAQKAADGPVYQANLERQQQFAQQQSTRPPTAEDFGGVSLDDELTGPGGGATDGFGSAILSGEGDWVSMFQALRAAGVDAAEASQLARREAAEATYTAQLKNAQTASRQNQLAAQQARQQISEGAFTQERQLLQAASQRGLGGSGVEQLAQTQQRISAGQNINQLTQQQMLSNEKLQNYLGDVEAQKDTKLAEADAQYYNDLFKLAGNDLENMKFLDSNQYRDKVFDWQQKNAADITANNNLNTRLDLIRLLESQDLSDSGKKAVAAMMLEAGKIGDQEANDLLDQYLGTAVGDKLVKGKYDWTSALVTGGLAAAGLTIATIATGGLSIPAVLIGSAIAGTIGGGVSQEIQNLQGNISFNIPGIGEWKGTRAEAINKSNPNSLVSKAFGDKQAFKDIQFTLEGTEVKFIYQGNTYDKFNDVQAVWLRAQGR